MNVALSVCSRFGFRAFLAILQLFSCTYQGKLISGTALNVLNKEEVESCRCPLCIILERRTDPRLSDSASSANIFRCAVISKGGYRPTPVYRQILINVRQAREANEWKLNDKSHV